jgi:pSer/pThr/pTyr-binding forkhead associated (FHA) protein
MPAQVGVRPPGLLTSASGLGSLFRAHWVSTVPRFRLRFLLQEIDLSPGDTILGRSASCHITIEDPLVSRQHARVRVSGNSAFIKDLGSRNGTYLNGVRLERDHEVKDGDRVRVGTLELVFCVIKDSAQEPVLTRRVTGSLCRCGECGNAYPEELVQCPSCGSVRQVEEETFSGVIGDFAGWSLELVVDVLQKARRLGRWEDVERMLRRASPTVERLVAGGERISRTHLDCVAESAATLAIVRGTPEWANWILTIFATLSLVPNAQTTESLEQLAATLPGALAAAAHRLVSNVQANGGPGQDERVLFSRIQSLATPPGMGQDG